MKFPDSQRVRYQKNPLVEVICQLRFPKILRIEKEPPSEVQEAIRTDYPILEVGQGVQVAMPVAGSISPIAIGRGQSYDFYNSDRTWKLVLTGDFIAVSTVEYQNWETFREKLDRAVEAICPRYGITSFSRTGLRYQDVVVRSELNLTDRPWKDLLRTEFSGALASTVFDDQDLQEALSVIAFKLDDDKGSCRVRHGLAKENSSGEFGYLIDADFFTDRQTEVASAREILDYYNREAGRLFRWCISPALHAAMEPQPVT